MCHLFFYIVQEFRQKCLPFDHNSRSLFVTRTDGRTLVANAAMHSRTMQRGNQRAANTNGWLIFKCDNIRKELNSLICGTPFFVMTYSIYLQSDEQ